MGGVFAVLPAYEADLYGAKYIGAIHGRFLTFAAAATVLGPTLLLNLKKMAETEAINGTYTTHLSAFWQLRMIHNIVETDKQQIHIYMSPPDLLTKVDPQVFTAKFGCSLEGAQSLVEAKTLTLSKLMTIMPPGTVDPR